IFLQSLASIAFISSALLFSKLLRTNSAHVVICQTRSSIECSVPFGFVPAFESSTSFSISYTALPNHGWPLNVLSKDLMMYWVSLFITYNSNKIFWNFCDRIKNMLYSYFISELPAFHILESYPCQ